MLDVALLAYKLADVYHQDPDVFLDKPVMDILEHMIWTNKMLDKRKG